MTAAGSGQALGSYLSDVESALAGIEKDNVIERMWRKDHTVWKPDPTEITDRLGWLTVTELMEDQVRPLRAFADDIRAAGYGHVVVLGVGGSSLGPEVLKRTFGSAAGYPEFVVLDSTVPASVLAVTEAIDPAKTLFLVSSKSGSTLEPNTLYACFRELVDRAIGPDAAGQNFVAITDPGTPLENLARSHDFRRVFLNPPDIGGRYSVLSYFGLVPAALAGIDIEKLLYRADCIREGCDSCVPVHDNPGVWLGAVMGTLAQQGRDKLTLVATSSVGSFGLWAEQLIAESTGKDGKGIVPVAGEPLVATDSYGDDRLFVYLRMQGDDCSDIDDAIARMTSSGHPVARLDLRDKYDLGAEFFRWEVATAVAGAILGVNPFDQPDVQGSKDETARVLSEYVASDRLPATKTVGSIEELLSQAREGHYLAIMAYGRETPESDLALSALREEAMARSGIATTLGYGPRYLHSTGQLHKGGPDTGLFLQIVSDADVDVDIPGESYTFGMLARAQADGDLRTLQALGRRVARIKSLSVRSTTWS